MFAIKRKKRDSAIKRIRAKFGRNIKHEILIFCSGRNIYAQIVNLSSGLTETTLSTCNKNDNKKNHRNIETAKNIGKKLADECKKRNIKDVSFNRAEKIFHGVVKAVADGFYQK